MANKELTRQMPLLNGKGQLFYPGYAKSNLYDYRRADITAHWSRIKEWDFYQITNHRYTVQIVVADISIGGAGTFACLDMATGQRCEAMNLSLLTRGKLGLCENAMEPHTLINRGKNFELCITVEEGRRHLSVRKGKNIHAEIDLQLLPDCEYLVMAVPFQRPEQFYLNQMMNCMAASGHVRAGDMEFDFFPENAFCVLDWGRGVWPHRCSWYWGNGSTRLPDGKIFGFEIGWGFGDMSAATENMLFYDGKGHKINHVFLEKDEKDWMQPWKFTSDDGRFEMTMLPFYDNFTSSRVGEVGNVCHQVFGKWNGTAVLDNGQVIPVRDMVAFCEFSDNRW